VVPAYGYQMEYLLVVDYHSDAERKRIDATIDRWKSKKDVHKERGVAILVRDEVIEDFLQDLYARLERGSEDVRIYSAEESVPDIREATKTLYYETSLDKDALKQFLRYVLNKLNSSYEGVRNGVESYTAYTRKGQATVGLLWSGDAGATHLNVTVSGFGDVVSLVAGRIDEELQVFLGSGK
jgi:hypothetical protein